MKLTIVILIAAVMTLSATAGHAASYRCEIEKVSHSDSDPTAEWQAETAKKFNVVIDRVSGKVFHPTIGNESFKTIVVLNKGSSENSFKVLSISASRIWIRTYQVQEFVEGNKKPFFAAIDSFAVFGTCE